MINKNTMNNWINMEASGGLHCELFDSNKSLFNKVRDESHSEGFKHYFGQSEEPYQPTNPFSSENTINFADIEKRLFNHNQNSPSPEHPSRLNQNVKYEEKWAENDPIFKRGLKYLASLLLKTLLKKRFSSHNEVAQQIEKHLMLNDLHGIENIKQQKNIKRRIYDALNVMISARVLEKELHGIQPRPQTISKNYSIVNRTEEFKKNLKNMKARLETKRELLAKMQSKRNALFLWTEKKGRVKQKQADLPRFQFPLVILICDSRQRLRLQMGQTSTSIGFNWGEVYSETDLIEQVVKEQYLRFQLHTIKQQQKIAEEITYV